MPFGDRTGPEGKGPKTGRGQGKCKPSKNDASQTEQRGTGADRGSGQGRGQGSGRGQGRGSGKGPRNR